MATSFNDFTIELLETLRDALGAGWYIVDGTPQNDVAVPTLAVQRNNVRKLEAAPRAYLSNEIVVFLIMPPGTKESVLNDSLEDALQALDDSPFYGWQEAQRAVYSNTSPAYTITFTAQTNRLPKD